MSNFSFSHSVFKRLVSQGRQKVSLCGNGLIHYTLGLLELEKMCSMITLLTDCKGPKNPIKGTRPSGWVSSKRYLSCCHFHSSFFQSIQTERVAKLRFFPSELGRFLELMPVFPSYKLRFQMKLNLLKRSVNFLKYHWSAGHQVNLMAVRYINLYQNKGPIDWQNIAVRLTWNYIP